MGMLPIFVLGLAVGALVSLAYIEHKKETPSNVKIESMEQIIEGLKEDIKILETTNEELRKKQTRKVKTEK